jgi:hypothetical protein
MHDNEAVEMMTRAAAEIEALRAQIDILAPRARAYEQITLILGLLPRQSQGYGEDVARMLRKRIEDVRRAVEEAKIKDVVLES